ncbi:MAG: aminotransferase class V-fold PLP-dependent enzyme [Myxococcota bacterium]|nr:aminotransferase class V-fold PLP-dependent enzyme [Myxococcota bacterium]
MIDIGVLWWLRGPMYLDYNATAPIRPSVLGTMEDIVLELRNPMSLHRGGRKSRVLLDQARETILECLGLPKGEVIWTSSGTESDYLAIKGLARLSRFRNPKATEIWVSSFEHPAVMACAQSLSKEGFEVHVIPTGLGHCLDFDWVSARLSEKVAVISVMMAHNETGVLLPVEELTALAQPLGVPVHTDAVQAVGKVPVSFADLGVDALSIAAHKFGGPRGIGAVLVPKGIRLEPIWRGGAQEDGMRPGTHALPLVIGMTHALKEALTEMELGYSDVRGQFEEKIRGIDGIQIIGESFERLPNTSLVGSENAVGGDLIGALNHRGVSVSGGSACHGHLQGQAGWLSAFTAACFSNVGRLRFSFDPSDRQLSPAVLARHLIRAIEQVRSQG